MTPPSNIPSDAQWLGGIGAGAFYWMESKTELYEITSWNEDGKQLWRALFSPTKSNFDIHQSYDFTYLSHHLEVNILQGKEKYTFHNVAYKRDR